MVVGARLVGIRVSSRCDSPGPNVLVRLLGRGLGSTLSRHRRFRPLVTNRSSSVHQSQRTNSSQVGNEALSPSFTGSGCRGFLRQFNHGSLPEEAGGNSVFSPQSRDSDHPKVDRGAPNHLGAPVHLRTPQRSGKLVVQTSDGAGLLC